MRRRSTGARGLQAGELEITLKKGQVRKLAVRNRDLEIHCSSGSLWITWPRDSKDVVLSSGQDFRPGSVDGLILEALQDSKLRLRSSGLEVVA